MRYSTEEIARFVKERRHSVFLTQAEFADKAGVGLRFIRELEQGKTTMRMDKVNLVLSMFGAKLGVVPLENEDMENC